MDGGVLRSFDASIYLNHRWLQQTLGSSWSINNQAVNHQPLVDVTNQQANKQGPRQEHYQYHGHIKSSVDPGSMVKATPFPLVLLVKRTNKSCVFSARSCLAIMLEFTCHHEFFWGTFMGKLFATMIMLVMLITCSTAIFDGPNMAINSTTALNQVIFFAVNIPWKLFEKLSQRHSWAGFPHTFVAFYALYPSISLCKMCECPFPPSISLKAPCG